MADFASRLTQELKSEPSFLSQDGELLREAVIDAAHKADPILLERLLSFEDSKKKFFNEISGYYVFDVTKFVSFVQDKNFLNDSYTNFKNKIGLATDGKFLNEVAETVLVWPFKDCILEGGMTREEEKRKEIFFNQTLAHDELDKLLAPKVLTSWQRHTKSGIVEVDKIERDERGVIKENLIIKGNNLLALHSLLSQFKESVKLIYIDPPYGKDADTFYNDNFKSSTWLTFMKNRLDIARKLLVPDGAIFVQISDANEGRLRLLMDEVFGKENFINKITVRTKSPSGFQTVNPGVFEVAEYLLVYGKEKGRWTYHSQFIKSGFDSNYSNYIINKSETPIKWKIVDLYTHVAKGEGFITPKLAIEAIGEHVFQAKLEDFALLNAESIFQATAIGDDAGKETIVVREKSKKSPGKVFVVERESGSRFVLNGRELAFYSKKVRNIDGEMTPSVQLTNIWSDISWEGIASEGGVKLKGGKKPERLIRRILALGSQKGDLVLDFFVGSGTTAAVAHKMGRRYVGIEQLDYEVNDSVHRLQNVIEGDKTGVSKLENWKDGGNFVFCELAKYNERFMDQIQEAKDNKALILVWKKMKGEAFFEFNPDLVMFESNLGQFKNFPLKQQKELLCQLLNKNQLYVNFSEINDADFKISKKDKNLNKAFYSK